MTGVTRERLDSCERTVAKAIDDFGRGLTINLATIMAVCFIVGGLIILALR